VSEVNEVSKTIEQIQAIETTDSSIALVAGAGAGKTMVLVERIIYLVQNQVPLENILAITFTQKAALEMKIRLVEKLNRIALQHKDDTEQYNHYQNLAVTAYTSSITTIDSFISHILREFAYFAKLDPLFTIQDPAHEYIEISQYINQLLEEILHSDDHPLSSHLSHLLEHFSQWNINRLLQVLLQNRSTLLDKIENHLNYTTNDDYNQIKTLIDKFCRNFFQDKDIIALLNTIKQSKYDPYIDYARKIETLTNLPIEELSHAVKNIISCSPQKPSVTSKDIKSDPAKKQLIANAAKAITSIKKQIGILTTSPFCFTFNQQSLEWLNDLAQLALKISKKQLKRKHLLAHYAFNDLSQLAFELLSNNSYVTDILRNRFQHILVDEFQDTNQLQVDLIKKIAGPDNLFVVGDPKQSIYAFRGADVEVFNRMLNSQTQLSHKHKIIHLQHNFRTTPSIIEFFNHLFTDTFTDTFTSAEQNDDQPQDKLSKWELNPKISPITYKPLVAGRIKAPDSSDANRIKLITLDPQLESQDLKRAMALVTAKEIKKLTNEQSCKYGDFAILLPQMTDIAHYENALLKEKIPFRNYSSRAFYLKEEISDLYILIRAFTHCAEDINFAAFLKLPFVGFDDNFLFSLFNHPAYRRTIPLKDNFFILASQIEDTQDKQNNQDKQIPQNTRYTEGAEIIKHRYNKIQKVYDQLSMIDFLYEIINTFRIKEWFLALPHHEITLSNLNKFIQIVKKHVSAQPLNKQQFTDQLAEIFKEKDLRETEALQPDPSANHVSIMTVHAAKGLQFKIVILPNIQKPFSYTPDVFLHSRNLDNDLLGFRPPIRNGGTGTNPDLYHHLLAKFAKKQAIEEEKRLFYVALTRTEEALIFIGQKLIKNTHRISWQSWIEKAFQQLPRLTTIEEVTIPNLEKDGFFQPIAPKYSLPAGDLITKIKPKLILDETISSPSPFNINVSAFIDYKENPDLYYQKHIQRLSLNQIKSKPNSSFYYQKKHKKGRPRAELFGSIIHLALDKFNLDKLSETFSYQNTDTSTVTDTSTDTDYEETIIDALSEILIANTDIANELDEIDIPSLVEYLKDISSAPYFDWLQKKEIISTWKELPFTYQNGIYTLTGTIDRLDQTRSGFIITDYKTTSSHLYPKENFKPSSLSRHSGHSKRYYYQLGLYALAIKSIYNLPTDQPIQGVIFYTEDKTFECYEFDEKEMNINRLNFIETCQSIQHVQKN